MFEKTHKKHVFQRINSFYNRLEYVYNCVKIKYPIIDDDTKERDLLLENLTNLMTNFKEDIFAYKNKKLTFSELEYKLEKYLEAFEILKLDFPILECFLVPPPFITGDSIFPLTDILNCINTFPK